jgi:Mce-associated membrane protein
VPSFRRRASVLDADRVEKAPQEPDPAADVAEAEALAEQAEAEAAEAEAIAAAARARAKAIRLRRQAEAAEAVSVEDEPAEDEPTEDVADTVAELDQSDTAVEAADADDEEEVEAPEEAPARKRRLRLPRPSWKRLAVGVAILCTCALLAASGYMIWLHRDAAQEQQRSAEYAAAGRQSVVTLMSLDFNKAQEDVQRIIDNSTGQFKDDFQNQAEDFVKVAQESKVVTEVTVNATAVQSMTPDSAVVLVAATSRVTNAAGAQQEPRSWRLSVSLQRDGGQIKMSKVEFVP